MNPPPPKPRYLLEQWLALPRRLRIKELQRLIRENTAKGTKPS